MPIYEYKCESCEAIHEFFLKVSDPAPEKCPSCSATRPLVKQISQTSFALKGEGWYVTDYKGTQKKSDESSAKDTTDPKGSADAKSEAPSSPESKSDLPTPKEPSTATKPTESKGGD